MTTVDVLTSSERLTQYGEGGYITTHWVVIVICRPIANGVFIDRLRKTFAGTKSDLVIGLMSTSAYLATPPA